MMSLSFFFSWGVEAVVHQAENLESCNNQDTSLQFSEVHPSKHCFLGLRSPQALQFRTQLSVSFIKFSNFVLVIK